MNRVFNGLTDYYYSNTSLNPPSSSTGNLGAVFMNTPEILIFLSLCLEGFLYGNISVLCAVPSLLVANEVQLFSGLGIYSGIFAIYLQCHGRPPNESRTANVVFYIICLLYIFSTVSIVCDLLNIILEVSNNPFCKNIIFTISRAVDFQWTIASTSN